MLPNPLLKHIYNNASDDVIRRGKKIFHTSGASLVDYDQLTERAEFRVRNDIYNSIYRVIINNYITTENLNTRCNCPYNMGTVCKHEAASLLQLNELIQTGYFDSVNVTYDQSHTLIRMRSISEQHMKLFASEDIQKIAKKIASKASSSIKIHSAADDTVKATITDDEKQSFEVVVAQNAERYFETSCGCTESKHPLCKHKYALLQHLHDEKGANYFTTLRNWDNEKNKLLALYGFSLEDDLKGKFEFAFVDGKLSMRVLNAGLKKLTDPAHPNNLKKAQEEQIAENEEIFVVFNDNGPIYPFFDMRMASAVFKDNAPKGTINFPSLQQVQSIITLNDEVKSLALSTSKINKDELIKALKRDLPFGDFVNTLESDLSTIPVDDLRKQVWEYYWPKVSKLFDLYKEFDKAYIAPKNNKGDIKSIDLIKTKFSDTKYKLRLYISPATKGKNADVHIHAQILLNETILKPENVTLLAGGFLFYENTLFAAENSNIAYLINNYNVHEPLLITHGEWINYLEDNILKLDNRVIISFHDALQSEVKGIEPTISVQIKEVEEKYVFLPVFDYNGVKKKWLDASPAIISDKGKVITYERNEASENIFLNTIKYLHPNMQERRKLQGFVLPVKDALKKGWYFDFIELMKSKDIHLFGFDQIKQSRINPNKPVANIQFTTGIDWFTANMEVTFGDQTVTLAELKKVLSKNENTIKLKDGSQGLITEDFIEQYGLMIKMGKVEGNEIKISKIHFSTIENLAEVQENDEIFQEIEEKRKRLLDFDYDNAEKEELPDNLHAELRPYQKSGFQWMGFLSETGWGGILADDMGLGKTVQTLSSLIRAYNNNPNARFLVCCPTTLIYNWESECKKFTPDISYHIYHGANRKKDMTGFDKSNLIITTYGTLRSDIEMISKIEWDYVVLDESQAIKNPLSQASKASLKLVAKNRLALSGTPIQNNTFDLYAQMNFLNPGMLGSVDFFKNEFAIPIDKMQDATAKSHLKKLIYPFLLRRTKEQVAPDLPPKTETVLFCEMGAAQRKIYESYRQQFKSQIMGSIEEVGLERSQMSILTGLMKLRQICDSPAILKEADQLDNVSIKLEELTRELTENVINHKALVFSQFLGMLDLIRKELDKQGIPYVYFDGGTTGTEREKAIKRFQEDDTCKVFLISLKAGGVGLNLTAADYVYIVDPWWNPAVEQQAIDRTHRIGQKKNIFAYRMICKDTIEEKILLLQERKLGLAKELISEDAAFLKKLTKDDVEFLLS